MKQELTGILNGGNAETASSLHIESSLGNPQTAPNGYSEAIPTPESDGTAQEIAYKPPESNASERSASSASPGSSLLPGAVAASAAASSDKSSREDQGATATVSAPVGKSRKCGKCKTNYQRDCKACPNCGHIYKPRGPEISLEPVSGRKALMRFVGGLIRKTKREWEEEPAQPGRIMAQAVLAKTAHAILDSATTDAEREEADRLFKLLQEHRALGPGKVGHA